MADEKINIHLDDIDLDNDTLEDKTTKVIKDEKNPLTEEDRQFIKELYSSISQLIKHSMDGKSIDEIGFEFWLKLLAQIIILVEDYGVSGIKKKYLVIETVVVVIKREVKMKKEDKEMIILTFRRIAPKIIDIVVAASKRINIDSEQVADCIATKLCCCLCAPKTKK